MLTYPNTAMKIEIAQQNASSAPRNIGQLKGVQSVPNRSQSLNLNSLSP